MLWLFFLFIGVVHDVHNTNINFAAALIVARKETWHRRAIWNRVQDFHALTGIPINSHIISLIVGNEEKAEQATQFGFVLYLFVCVIWRLFLQQHLTLFTIDEQEFVEIWIPCNWYHTPCSATQLMQVFVSNLSSQFPFLLTSLDCTLGNWNLTH